MSSAWCFGNLFSLPSEVLLNHNDLGSSKAQVTACTFLWQIAIMGCIVNGPGEMADADFGYVGGAPGKIDLYVGKVCSPSFNALGSLLGCVCMLFQI